MSRKTEVFAAYGDQTDDALRNWQQIDGPGYEAFAAEAVRRMYLADFRRWSRSQTIDVVKGTEPDPSDRLFAPPAARPEAVTVRAKLVHDGDEVSLLDLARPRGRGTPAPDRPARPGTRCNHAHPLRSVPADRGPHRSRVGPARSPRLGA